MIVYYKNTLLFRAWLLEDVKSQPLDITELTAEAFIKKSNDEEAVLFTFSNTDDTMMLYQETEDGSLKRAWAELSVPNLDIEPGDYVFYAYLLFPQKQLIEHCHMIVLNSAETEVTP